jgi:midasin
VGAKLVAFNLSQQTDSSDLLGGFRPVGAQEALLPLLAPFQGLVRATWTRGNNESFLSRVTKYAERRKWHHLLSAYKTALAKVGLEEPGATSAGAEAAAAGDAKQDVEQQLLQERRDSHQNASTSAEGVPAAAGGGEGGRRQGKAARGRGDKHAGSQPSKKRRTAGVAAEQGDAPQQQEPPQAAAGGEGGAEGGTGRRPSVVLAPRLASQWQQFQQEVSAAERAAAASEGGFAFSFVEGQLVQALREGWWLLLDEVNLAPPEVLERIAGLLDTPPDAAAAHQGGPAGATTSSSHQGLLLVERGDAAVIQRHPNFRLVAAMNPATDAGKRELPPALRARFTELWVPEPRGREDLALLVGGYLAGAAPSPPVEAVVDLYVAAKQAAVGC